MNFELGWRDVGITLFAIAQHFSLFTLHYSLPAETTFHFALFTILFPKGPLFTLHFSLFTSRRDYYLLPTGTALHSPKGAGWIGFQDR